MNANVVLHRKRIVLNINGIKRVIPEEDEVTFQRVRVRVEVRCCLSVFWALARPPVTT